MDIVELLKQTVESHASDLQLNADNHPALSINSSLKVLIKEEIITPKTLDEFDWIMGALMKPFDELMRKPVSVY